MNPWFRPLQDAAAFIQHPSNSARFWSAVAGAQRTTPLWHPDDAKKPFNHQ